MPWRTRIVYSLRKMESLALDVFVAACALWGAKCMLFGAPNFTMNPAPYDVMKALFGERIWGIIGLVGGLCTIAALFKEFPARVNIRVLGLACSAFLLIVAGISFLFANPDSISSGVLILAGLLALGRLSAWPSGAEGPD